MLEILFYYYINLINWLFTQKIFFFWGGGLNFKPLFIFLERWFLKVVNQKWNRHSSLNSIKYYPVYELKKKAKTYFSLLEQSRLRWRIQVNARKRVIVNDAELIVALWSSQPPVQVARVFVRRWRIVFAVDRRQVFVFFKVAKEVHFKRVRFVQTVAVQLRHGLLSCYFVFVFDKHVALSK